MWKMPFWGNLKLHLDNLSKEIMLLELILNAFLPSFFLLLIIMSFQAISDWCLVFQAL